MDGDFATSTQIAHLSEEYRLEGNFVVDRQNLISNRWAKVLVRLSLTCNGRPISLGLLQDPQLQMIATTSHGEVIATSTTTDLSLSDSEELVHEFLVPEKLSQLSFSLSGKVLNLSRGQKQAVTASATETCNGIHETRQIGDIYFQRTDQGYQLLVLGRNGEAIENLPVQIKVKPKLLKREFTSTLATNAKGIVQLGSLENVDSLLAAASGIRASRLTPNFFHRQWPAIAHIQSGEVLTLPMGKSESSPDLFTLREIRRGVAVSDLNSLIKLDSGVLSVSGLGFGDFELLDHEYGQSVKIRVVDSQENKGGFLVGKHRVLESRNPSGLAIQSVELRDEKIEAEFSGATEDARVHVVTHAFHSREHLGSKFSPFTPSLMWSSRSPKENFYVDSLKLDEEYSYILERQGLDKYAGNMLPQPSLLVRPWEVSVTENSRRDAAGGEMAPADAAPASPAMEGEPRMKQEAFESDSTEFNSFEFLKQGSASIANLPVVDGKVSIPINDLTGFSELTLLVMGNESCDSRRIVLPATELQKRDRRLRNTLPTNAPLAQEQRVVLLPAGEEIPLGEGGTRNFQAYSTLSDVFQLYGSLLQDKSKWEQFRFLTQWPELTQEEQLAKYSQFACHEVNLFLYYKDRRFYDRVVAPILQQKLEKQLIDHLLLGLDVESFNELWQVRRMNALERALLGNRLEDAKTGTKRWFEELVMTNPISDTARQTRFGLALQSRGLEELQLNREGVALGLVIGSARGAQAGDEFFDSDFASEPPAFEAPSGGRRGGQMRKQSRGYFGAELKNVDRFYQSLDKTREWAETNYYKVRLGSENNSLIPPNPFWKQFFTNDCEAFLPTDLDLPVSNLSEALCALAVIDLPYTADRPEVESNDGTLVAKSKTPAILFVESIKPTQEATPEGESPILVGQDIYLADEAGRKNSKPIQSEFLKGVGYTAKTFVSNPSSSPLNVHVLTQIPAGAIALAGGEITQNVPLQLGPYSTQQVENSFYFPEHGAFDRFGASVSSEGKHLASVSAESLPVLAEPNEENKESWSYVADWSSDSDVLQYLEEHNLQEMDLARIAFRMKNKSFYSKVVELLSASGEFDPQIWGYSVLHNDVENIEQLIQSRPDFASQLGQVLNSPIVQLNPQIQRTFEHLDYKPLVVARTHQLGPKPLILNSNMHAHYHQLLQVLGRAIRAPA